MSIEQDALPFPLARRLVRYLVQRRAASARALADDQWPCGSGPFTREQAHILACFDGAAAPAALVEAVYGAVEPRHAGWFLIHALVGCGRKQLVRDTSLCAPLSRANPELIAWVERTTIPSARWPEEQWRAAIRTSWSTVWNGAAAQSVPIRLSSNNGSARPTDEECVQWMHEEQARRAACAELDDALCAPTAQELRVFETMCSLGMLFYQMGDELFYVRHRYLNSRWRWAEVLRMAVNCGHHRTLCGMLRDLGRRNVGACATVGTTDTIRLSAVHDDHARVAKAIEGNDVETYRLTMQLLEAANQPLPDHARLAQALLHRTRNSLEFDRRVPDLLFAILSRAEQLPHLWTHRIRLPPNLAHNVLCFGHHAWLRVLHLLETQLHKRLDFHIEPDELPALDCRVWNLCWLLRSPRFVDALQRLGADVRLRMAHKLFDGVCQNKTVAVDRDAHHEPERVHMLQALFVTGFRPYASEDVPPARGVPHQVWLCAPDDLRASPLFVRSIDDAFRRHHFSLALVRALIDDVGVRLRWHHLVCIAQLAPIDEDDAASPLMCNSGCETMHFLTCTRGLERCLLDIRAEYAHAKERLMHERHLHCAHCIKLLERAGWLGAPTWEPAPAVPTPALFTQCLHFVHILSDHETDVPAMAFASCNTKPSLSVLRRMIRRALRCIKNGRVVTSAPPPNHGAPAVWEIATTCLLKGNDIRAIMPDAFCDGWAVPRSWAQTLIWLLRSCIYRHPNALPFMPDTTSDAAATFYLEEARRIFALLLLHADGLPVVDVRKKF